MIKISMMLVGAFALATSIAACGDQGYGPTHSYSARVGSNGTAADATANNGSTSSSYEAPAPEGRQLPRLPAWLSLSPSRELKPRSSPQSPERVFDQTDVMQHRGVRAGGVAGQDLPHDGVVFLVGAHGATLDLELRVVGQRRVVRA